MARGDTLGGIALAFEMAPEDLQRLNGLSGDTVRLGQELFVLVPVSGTGPALPLIPDGALVNGPNAVGFDLASAVSAGHGYLESYTAEVDGETLTGAQIVARVSEQTSVHPRLLLAALEHFGGWVTQAHPTNDQLEFPLGHRRTSATELYYQLTWAAARLNEGYYGWRFKTRIVARFGEGGYTYLAEGLNAGSAGLQNLLAAAGSRATWPAALGPGADGFPATYRRLFGDPWADDRGALLPVTLEQPTLALPFARGETWFFTGGPHSAWGRGTPWGAIDFAPRSVLGCRRLKDWVLAAADGVITRSAHGELVQSLDPARDERIGWSLLYLHLASEGRAPLGAQVKAGDRLGHPSCEGGVSNGAHLHLVRRYNGEWLNSIGATPFIIGGWRVAESGAEYDGLLTRGRERREACECKKPEVNGVAW